MRNLSCCCAVLAGGFLLAGCDGDESASGMDLAPTAAIDDAVEVEAQVIGGDGPSRTVSLEWIDMVPGDMAEAGGLALKVTNLSSRDYQVAAKLLCSGLINKDAEMALETRELAAGMSTVFTVDAEEVPIQTTAGAAQARMELVLSRDTEAGTSERRMLTPVVYYRHDVGYMGLQVFDEQAFFEKNDGKLSGVAVGMETMGQVLGRVSDGEGGFVDVLLMDDESAAKKDGKIIGWETGMDISIGVDDETGEVAK